MADAYTVRMCGLCSARERARGKQARGRTRGVGEKSNMLHTNICPPGAFSLLRSLAAYNLQEGHLYSLRLCTPSVRHRVADVRVAYRAPPAPAARRRASRRSGTSCVLRDDDGQAAVAD